MEALAEFARVGSVAKVGADIGFIPNQHSKKWRFCLWGISVVYSKPLSFGEKRALGFVDLSD